LPPHTTRWPTSQTPPPLPFDKSTSVFVTVFSLACLLGGVFAVAYGMVRIYSSPTKIDVHAGSQESRRTARKAFAVALGVTTLAACVAIGLYSRS
jgi:hypothetical protein